MKNNFFTHRIKAARGITRRAVFFLTLGIILLAGCARQVRKPAPPPAKQPLVRVALTDKGDNGRLEFLGDFRLVAEEADYRLDKSLGVFDLFFKNYKFVLKSPKRQFVFHNGSRFKVVPEGSGQFKYNGSTYSGPLQFIVQKEGAAVVLTLPLEEYLQGVVPYEIPSHQEEYLEAVKAQTIAARSYTVYRLKHPQDKYFDLYADTRDQVFGGAEGHAELADRAIRETAGMILTDTAGNPVKTYYHSTCGGPLETGGATPDTTLKEFNCQSSPLYRWYYKLTAGQILRNLNRIGRVTDETLRLWEEHGFEMAIEIKERSQAGRILQAEVIVNNRRIRLNEGEIRRAFSNKPEGSLPSNLFIIKSSPSDTSRLYLIGGGFGHGRGMCQWGAIGQALKSVNFRQILKKYYPELVLKKEY
ncbi:MAG: SpoIID/LytB domain-containing protein [Calditrichia bacterium]